MPKNIVILGGGYGGIRTALDIAKFFKKNEPVSQRWLLYLIDKSDSHIFTPNLYEMATVLKEDATAWKIQRAVTLQYTEIFKNLPIRYIQDRIKEIDIKNKKIKLRDAEPIDYEILVLALGSETNFFNIEGLKRYSLPLKTVEDAVVIRNTVSAILATGDINQKAEIIIGGGGLTGVELAAELTRFIRRKHSLCRNKPLRKHEITIFEAGETILNGLPIPLINSVRERIRKLNIIIKEKTAINKAEKGCVYIKEENNQEQKVPYDILIWTGGTIISPIMESVITSKDKKGRCLVEPSLKVNLDETIANYSSQHVYALGDMICMLDAKTGKPLPGTAYIAIEEGKIVAKNIINEISDSLDQENIKAKYYPPKIYPFAIPLGGKNAIFNFGSLKIGGGGGWLIRILIDLHYFLTILPPHRAFLFWLNSILLMVKND